MKKPDGDGYSLLLLLSLLLFMVLSPFLEQYRAGELILLFLMYIAVVTTTLELSEKHSLQWPASILAGSPMLALLGAHFYPVQWIVVTSWTLLMIFFALASVGVPLPGDAGPGNERAHLRFCGPVVHSRHPVVRYLSSSRSCLPELVFLEFPYIAITVARLVCDYQRSDQEKL